MFLDIGSGIDAIAGVVDKKPYLGNWANYRIKDNFDYSTITFPITLKLKLIYFENDV